MSKVTDKMLWVQEGRSDKLIQSLYRTTTAALGSFSSASDCEVWKRAGVGVCRQQNGQEEEDNAISSMFLAQGDVQWR